MHPLPFRVVGLWDSAGKLLWISRSDMQPLVGCQPWSFSPESDRPALVAAWANAMFGNGKQVATASAILEGKPLNVRCVVEAAPTGVALISTAVLCPSGMALLSERERVLLEILGTRTTKQAAADMGITLSSAETYKRRAAEKLGLPAHRLPLFAAKLSSAVSESGYNG